MACKCKSYQFKLRAHIITFIQCCSPEINGGGGWGIFNALFGWTNSSTYGSVISYDLYWVFVMLGFMSMRYKETRGHWPFMKGPNSTTPEDQESQTGGSLTQGSLEPSAIEAEKTDKINEAGHDGKVEVREVIG
jgi:high-affinity iron transporter